MAQEIRLKKKYSLINIIFLCITLLLFVFGFIYLEPTNSRENDIKLYIAKVDGEGISRAGFEAQAREETQGIGTLGGDNSLEKSIRRNILATQIDNYLSYQLSSALKAQISDSQVEKKIQEQQIFFNNGSFDQQKFINILNSNGYSLDEYIESIRYALQKQQTIDAITLSDFVLPTESLELSALNSQQRTAYITYITPSIVDISDTDITEEELLEYYNTHLDSFYRKERVKLKYIVNFYPELMKQKINITDNEIKKEYEKNSDNYMFPAKHLYSVKLFDNITDANNSYSELSSSDINTSSVEDGLQLGWFSVNETLPNYLSEANLNKKGSISKPIKVDDKFVIVMLQDVQPAKLQPLDVVSYSIMSMLKKEKVDKLFEKQNKLMNQALNMHPTSIEDIAKMSKLELYESDWSYQKESYSIVRFPEIKDIVFSDEMIKDNQLTNKISKLIYTEMYNSTFIFQVVEHRNEGVAEFDEVKDEILQKIKEQKSNLQFKDSVNDYIKELQEKGKTDKIIFANRYNLTRNLDEADESIPFAQNVVDMIFNLTPSADDATVYGVEYLDDHRAYIAAMINITNPKDIPDISQEVRLQILNNTRYYLAKNLRDRSIIEIMPDSNL